MAAPFKLHIDGKGCIEDVDKIYEYIDLHKKITELEDSYAVKQTKPEQEKSTEQNVLPFNKVQKENKHSKITHSRRKKEGFPDPEDIVKYIVTKPDFIHDSRELQMHFFGKVFTTGGDKNSYTNIYNRIKRARELIAINYNGKWRVKERKNIDRQTNVDVFIFVRNPTQLPQKNESKSIGTQPNSIESRIGNDKQVAPISDQTVLASNNPLPTKPIGQ